MVIERATGQRLPEAVDQYIFKPLGLERAAIGTAETPFPEGTVRPYLSVSGQRFVDITSLEEYDAATGDGGVAINAQEVQVFLEDLLGGRLLQAASLNQMTQTLFEKPSEESDFDEWPGETSGLGIDLFRTDYGIAYGHTGRIFAFNALAFHFPETGSSLVIAYNGSDLSTEGEAKVELRQQLLTLMFD